MPTYTVRYANVTLSVEQQQTIAAAITQAHSASTGAPGYFAQVMFDPIANHFIGGQRNAVPHVYVNGLIRGGRTPEQKRSLMQAIAERVHVAAGVGAEDIWVYIQEIAPEQMLEFGRVLPQPGGEAEWQRGFTPQKLADFHRAGVAT